MEHNLEDSPSGSTTRVLALRDEIDAGQMRFVSRHHADSCTVDAYQGRDSFWIMIRREGSGGFALRAAYGPGRPLQITTLNATSDLEEFRVESAQGTFRITLAVPDPAKPLLRCTVRLTPSADLLPQGVRDLYPLDAQGDPAGTAGKVHAGQRGLNAGLVYSTLAEPRFGTLLYFQNLTALNDYFIATETLPDGKIGGQWPELGYLLPEPSAANPLPKGREVTLSDAFLCWSPQIPKNPRTTARLFLDLLADVYRHLERPESEYHDWPRRAAETVRDLDRSPDATVRHYGYRYLRPYVAAEHPDSMVQLTVLLPMREYQRWTGKTIPLTGELRAGLKRFFDPELGTLRRYLPNVGKGTMQDKDPDEVDSWYLYHPLSNLAKLASEGDEEAREMFLTSLDYGIKVARHFQYVWPVQYKVNTLEVIKADRKPGEPGQSDVGGLYAYVCLQAYEQTSNPRYLEEAKTAIHALEDRDFDLEYQANVTAMGAYACLRLWQITGEDFYRDQSHVFLACFFHNSLIWESEIAHARSYSNFLGATCLHDGPYMALYECFDSFEAFQEYLKIGGDDVPEGVRLLLTEYCKYTTSRAWYYYPRELPKDALATEVRNGRLDRTLAFPLEDLYGDGQPAGQVGQEIYGCGAAFAFVSRSYHRLDHAPFLLFCEYPVQDMDRRDPLCVSFRTRGAEGFSCRARLIPCGRKPLPRVTIASGQDRVPAGRETPEGHIEFEVRVGEEIELRWGDELHDR